MLVENVQTTEEVRNIDVCPTLLTLACFIARFHDATSYRLRLKYCTLCDTVFEKNEIMSIRKDNEARQNIVDVVIEWIQDPATVSKLPSSGWHLLTLIRFSKLMIGILSRIQNSILPLCVLPFACLNDYNCKHQRLLLLKKLLTLSHGYVYGILRR